jgi:hypothetical protein
MSTTNFAQGPTPATGARYEDFLSKVDTLADTPFNPAMLSSVAPLNPHQTEAVNYMFDTGMHLGDFDPARVAEIQSPFTQNVVNTTQDWFNNQNKIAANNLLSQGIRSGNAFGGDRAGVAAAEVGGQQQLAQAPVIAGLYQSGYTQALDEYNKLKAFSVQGAETAMKAGTVEQAQAQRELDVATANAQQQSAYPFQVANWEGAALGGIGPLTGTVGQGTTSTSANSTGVSTPPTPNPLTQALGIGSAIGGLFTSKDGGTVPRLASGGYVDDDSRFGSMFGGGGGDEYDRDERDRGRDDTYGKDTSIQTSGTKDEVLSDIEKVGQQKPTQDEPPNIFGAFKIPRYKQPYIRIPSLAAASSTGMGQQASPTTAPQASSGSAGSTIGGTLGSVAGTAIGGPIGGVIGGAAGKLFGGLFKHGGPVEAGPIRYFEAGGPNDEGDKGDTLDSGDPAVPARTPVTGNPEDERLFRERMGLRPGQSVPAEGTGMLVRERPPPSRDGFGLDKLPTRPSIPSPDPLAPFLGTEGPRSLTGPPRGSPAGNLPYQATEVAPQVLTRERVQRELEDNPRLARRFDANTTAEVGVKPVARQGYQASVIDRAVQEGQPLGNLVNNPNYYPWQTRASRAVTGQGVDDSLWAGANPINYGTGNASRDPRTGRDVGFAGGPQTASIGRERYGIEGQRGLALARASGYTGPDRTPIGFVPGAPVGSGANVTQLAGGPNTTGDLEVSGQKRTTPQPRQYDPTNLGYGPAEMRAIPGAPPRSFAERWATNPLTAAGIAMLRSQSPYLGTGVGEGLAGAAGAIEHNRAQNVLDNKPTLRTEFPTLIYQYPDGRMWDTQVPNPGYDAKKVARDRLDWEKQKALKEEWRPTGRVHPIKGTEFYNQKTMEIRWGTAEGPVTGKPGEKPPATGTVKPAPDPNAVPAKPSLQSTIELDPDNPEHTKYIIDPKPVLKPQVTATQKRNDKIMEEARKYAEGGNRTQLKLSDMKASLERLPNETDDQFKKRFLAQGPGYQQRLSAAQWVNYFAQLGGQKPYFDPTVVGSLEQSEKTGVMGGFEASRTTGGGTHNAAPIIQAAMRAFPNASQTVEGSRMIIASMEAAARRERERHDFLSNPRNQELYFGDLNQLEAVFNHANPPEKYAAQARMAIIPPVEVEWIKKYGSDPEAVEKFEKRWGKGLLNWSH